MLHARSWLVPLASFLLAAGSLAQSGAAPDTLQRDARGALIVDRSAVTGAVTFVRGGVASGTDRARLARDPEGEALRFLARHAEALGMPRAAAELRPIAGRTAVDELGMTHVRFEQRLHDVPVYGAQVLVHFSADGETVVAVNGDFVPGLDVPTRALVGARAAVHLARSIEPAAELAGLPELCVYSGRIDRHVAGDHLAWLVRLADAAEPSLRLYVVDAHAGSLLKTREEVCTARNRRIRNLGGGQTPPGTLVRAEGWPATGDLDVDACYEYAGDAYDFFLGTLGRDGWNNSGGPIEANVHYGVGVVNAFWNGSALLFGDGMAADDIVAHEYTHGVTQHTAGLIYEDESGAINESYSDILGEIVDLGNQAGTDTANTRWRVGEDSPIGAIRDMQDPPAYGQPELGSDYVCTMADNGGVHTNSGIANKAAYLMADGGSFNGYSVAGIGLVDTARVHYRALSTYLTPVASLRSNYAALNQACLDLAGTGGLTLADCLEVDEALQAVEMDHFVLCNVTCPAQTSAAAAPGAGPGALLALYRLRDGVLRRSPHGRRLIELFYAHAAEMARALAEDPGLARGVAALVARAAPALDALAGGRAEARAARVSAHDVALLAAVLRRFEEADPGGPGGLARAVAELRTGLDLAGLVGSTYASAWERFQARALPAPR